MRNVQAMDRPKVHGSMHVRGSALVAPPTAGPAQVSINHPGVLWCGFCGVRRPKAPVPCANEARPTRVEEASAELPKDIASGRRQEVLNRLCNMMDQVWKAIDPNALEPCDCACTDRGLAYDNSGAALDFMQQAIAEAINRLNRGPCTQEASSGTPDYKALLQKLVEFVRGDQDQEWCWCCRDYLSVANGIAAEAGLPDGTTCEWCDGDGVIGRDLARCKHCDGNGRHPMPNLDMQNSADPNIAARQETPE